MKKQESKTLDSIIFSSPIRLLIMILLLKNNFVKIKDLSNLTNSTSGNLDHHIRQLEEANYIAKFPLREKMKLIYAVKLTTIGREKILSQIGNLKNIIGELDL